jgi:hypothetical protein
MTFERRLNNLIEKATEYQDLLEEASLKLQTPNNN